MYFLEFHNILNELDLFVIYKQNCFFLKNDQGILENQCAWRLGLGSLGSTHG